MAAQEDLSKEKEKIEEEEVLQIYSFLSLSYNLLSLSLSPTHSLPQSVLKYVPLVGSVVSWFYPASPAGVKGRSFNLASGNSLSNLLGFLRIIVIRGLSFALSLIIEFSMPDHKFINILPILFYWSL